MADINKTAAEVTAILMTVDNATNGGVNTLVTDANIDDIPSNKIEKPSTEGSNGQVLTTNGAGGVSWTDKLDDTALVNAVSDWLDTNVDPTGAAVIVDSTLTISGAAADAKVTGDGLGTLRSAFNSSVSALDKTVCEFNNLVNYGYDTPQHRDADPTASATSSLRLGFTRTNTDIVLDSIGNTKWVAVKLDGEIATTAGSNATLEGWTPSVRFLSGHKYKMSTKLMSGTTSTLDASKHFYTGIFASGYHVSIGRNEYAADYSEHILTFDGDGNLYTVAFVALTGMTFTNAKFHIVIEDITKGTLDGLLDEVGQEAPSAADGYTWVIGGIKASGGNDSSTKRLRLTEYTLFLEYGTRVFCDDSVEIAVYEYNGEGTLLANSSDWGTEYNLQTLAGAYVRIALRLASDPDHIMTSSDLETYPKLVHYGASTGLIARVENLENQVINENVILPDYYKVEADDTISKTKNLQTEPCLVFPLVTDIHYKSAGIAQTFDAFINNAKYVLENVKADFILNLGDNTDGDHGDGSLTIERADYMLKKLITLGVPVYQSIGNHDTNYESNGTLLTIGQTYRAYISGTKDVVFNSLTNGTDYYKDFNDVGIRLVVVNSNYLNEYIFSADTVTWLDDALDTNNIVIFATHVSPVNTQNYNTQSCDNKAGIIGKLQDFIDGGGTLIQLTGHSHIDVSFASPWLAIASCCQKHEQADITKAGYVAITGYDSLGMVSPTRGIDTASADCWSMVIVRPIARKINLVRFGAGNDREYSF